MRNDTGHAIFRAETGWVGTGSPNSGVENGASNVHRTEGSDKLGYDTLAFKTKSILQLKSGPA
jgi:hypothetical protein